MKLYPTNIFLNSAPKTRILFITTILLGILILLAKTSLQCPKLKHSSVQYFPINDTKILLSSLSLQYNAKELIPEYRFIAVSARFVENLYFDQNYSFFFTTFITGKLIFQNQSLVDINESHIESVTFSSSNLSNSFLLFYLNPLNDINSFSLKIQIIFHPDRFLNLTTASQIEGIQLFTESFNPTSTSFLFFSRGIVSIIISLTLSLLVLNKNFKNPDFFTRLHNLLALFGAFFMNPLSLLFPRISLISLFDQIFQALFNCQFKLILLLQLFCIWKILNIPNRHHIIVFISIFFVYFILDVINCYISEKVKLQSPLYETLEKFNIKQSPNLLRFFSLIMNVFIFILHLIYFGVSLTFSILSFRLIYRTNEFRRYIITSIFVIINALFSLGQSYILNDSFLPEILCNTTNAVLAAGYLFSFKKCEETHYQIIEHDKSNDPESFSIEYDPNYDQDLVD